MFSKGEYNFSSKEFNPLKFFIIIILFSNLIFTIYLLKHFIRLHDIIEVSCPQILEIKKETKEKKEEKVKKP